MSWRRSAPSAESRNWIACTRVGSTGRRDWRIAVERAHHVLLAPDHVERRQLAQPLRHRLRRRRAGRSCPCPRSGIRTCDGEWLAGRATRARRPFDRRAADAAAPDGEPRFIDESRSQRKKGRATLRYNRAVPPFAASGRPTAPPRRDPPDASTTDPTTPWPDPLFTPSPSWLSPPPWPPPRTHKILPPGYQGNQQDGCHCRSA